MARGRIISNTLGDSEKFSSLTDARHQVAFMLLITWADAEGRFIADPITLNGKLFTRLGWTPEEVRTALDELHQVRLIRLYDVEDKPYGVVEKFHEHNTITRKADGTPAREAASTLPPPPEQQRSSSATPEQPLHDDSASTDDTLRNDSTATAPEVEVEVKHQHQEKQPRAHAREAGSLKEGKKGNRQKPPPFDAKTIPLPDFVSPDVWRDFADHRREINKPLTERAAKLTLEDLGKHPDHADDMLRTSIKRGWTGVFPPDKPRDGPRTGPAAEAWDAILDAAHKGRPPDDLDPKAKAALQAVGGWSSVAYCPNHLLGQKRAKFLDAYDTKRGKAA